MELLIFYVAFALLVSFACSLMEASLLSVSNSYIMNLVNKNNRAGKILQELKGDIDRPLAAILTLNTIANTLGATGAGAQAQLVFSSTFLGYFVAAFTLAILFFSEITPKTIGAVYWRQTAIPTAYVLRVLVVVLYPFIALARFITKAFSRGKEISHTVFREEISVMAGIGEDIGALSGPEENVIRNILKLSNVKVRDILTPRTVMVMLEKDMTVGDVIEEFPKMSVTRLPVYEGNPDRITGMVLRHDILDAAARDQHEKVINDMLRPIHPIPESLSVAKALELFIKRREHMFLVIDEYGGTSGIVTLEDVMEALLGTEIVDEKDAVADMRELALRLWRYQTMLATRREEAARSAKEQAESQSNTENP